MNWLNSKRGRFGARTAIFAAGTLVAAGMVAAALPATAATATADAGPTTRTYTASQTTPVPPASSFAGSGGGDGWGLAMTDTAVYNVFHHDANVTVACHQQVDASPCWTAPKTITDADGHRFSTSFAPGVTLDAVSGHLFVYATRANDTTGGVVCIDTTQPADVANPFCGFTPLTAVGESPMSGSSWSALSAPALVGSKWYAVNNVNNSPDTGAKNATLCFDVKTEAACAGQPYHVGLAAGTGAGTVTMSDTVPPVPAAIGNAVFETVTVDGVSKLACLDGTTHATCAGTWPVTVGSSGAAPIPLLSAAGEVAGVCLPTRAAPCFSLDGSVATTPANLGSTMGSATSLSGAGLVLGPRVYLAVFGNDQVLCYDFNLEASCSGFPKSFANASLLYTVNADPQRPDCIWINSDNGSAQIQNFDAYTGAACGTGSVRVLASRIVAPTQECAPNSYTTLQIVAPDRETYSSGTVSFLDGDGQPISGATDQALDDTGSVDLTQLDLNTDAGLPQFLITLSAVEGEIGEVTAKLTWTAPSDASCRPPSAVTLTPDSGTSDQPFTIRYSCAYVATVEVTNADGTEADGVVLDEPATTNDFDYEQTVHLKPGSYVATVGCHDASARSEMATVTAPAPKDPPAPTDPGPPPAYNPPAPTSPSPSPSSSTATRQKLNLVAPEQALTPGHQAYLTATGQPNTPVDLRCYTRPSTTYVTSRQVTLDNTGRTDFTLKLPASTRCFARYTDGVGGQSNSVKILVHAHVSLGAVRTGAKSYVFGGWIHPVDGQTISVWRLGAGRPILTAQVSSNGTTSWRAPVTFIGHGTYQFVATTPNTLTYASGTSNVITLSVA